MRDILKSKNISIIPARGGSKGVHKKNIKLLSGKPLIAYTIETSLACKYIDKTIVSTEDEEIAAIAKRYGADAIMRPPDLAQDTSPTEPAMQHVVSQLISEGYKPDFIALLQCTAPFRTVNDLDNAFGLLKNDKYDALMSVTEIDAHYHPCWLKTIENDEIVSPFCCDEPDVKIIETKKYYQRQLLPGKYYWKNGSIYIFTHDSLMELGHRYGTCCAPLVIEKSRAINIDTEADFRNAERYIKEMNL